MPQWTKIAIASELPVGDSKAVKLDGECIALFNVKGDFFAVSNVCPHAAGPLVEGFIEKGRVTCPWHAWSFPLACEDPPNDGLRRYPLQVEGDDILIDFSG